MCVRTEVTCVSKRTSVDDGTVVVKSWCVAEDMRCQRYSLTKVHALSKVYLCIEGCVVKDMYFVEEICVNEGKYFDKDTYVVKGTYAGDSIC